MFVYEEAWSYEGYLDSDLSEYRVKQEKIFDRIQLSEESINKIKNIKTIINIVVFAEIYCPDCRAIVPYLIKFAELNDNVNINIFPREGNEVYLERHSETSSIPLILVEDIQKGEDEFVNIFEERLPSIIEATNNAETEEDEDEIIYRFRTGKHNEEIEEYLVEKILELA